MNSVFVAQPFATHIAWGRCRTLNRSGMPAPGCPRELAIVSGRELMHDALERFSILAYENAGLDELHPEAPAWARSWPLMPLGAVVAVASLRWAAAPSAEPAMRGDPWYSGGYAWCLGEVVPLPEPVRVRSSLPDERYPGLRALDADCEARVRAQLAAARARSLHAGGERVDRARPDTLTRPDAR